jgi:hypothetical protein
VRGIGIHFWRDGRARRVNPDLFSQFGEYNRLLLPTERELPKHGLITRIYPFDFGYAFPNNSLAPYAQADCPLLIGRDFLVWAITRTYSTVATTNPPVAGTPGANGSPGLLINFLHTHNGVQRQLMNKPLTDDEFGGDGQYPMILKEPMLLAEGDTIMCTLQNLLNATMQAQVVFIGGEFDTDNQQGEAQYA